MARAFLWLAYPDTATMPGDPHLQAYKHVLSMERLVREVRGLQTPDAWYEIKRYAINKNTGWDAYVAGLSELSVFDRILWCESFLEDLLLLHRHTITFEKDMVQNGADLNSRLGSQAHETRKLHTLLYKGEHVVFNEDVCEDVFLRSARRLRTLVEWARTVSVCVHCHPSS